MDGTGMGGTGMGRAEGMQPAQTRSKGKTPTGEHSEWRLWLRWADRLPMTLLSREATTRTPRTGRAYFFGGSGVHFARSSLASRRAWRHGAGGRVMSPQANAPLSDLATNALYQAMQGLWAEQQAVANNVANVDTPGYLAKDVNFEPSLAQAIANGDPSQMQVTVTTSTAAPQQDGNNVNLADQMVEGEKASLQFQTMVDALNAKFQLLGTAISESPTG